MISKAAEFQLVARALAGVMQYVDNLAWYVSGTEPQLKTDQNLFDEVWV